MHSLPLVFKNMRVRRRRRRKEETVVVVVVVPSTPPTMKGIPRAPLVGGEADRRKSLTTSAIHVSASNQYMQVSGSLRDERNKSKITIGKKCWHSRTIISTLVYDNYVLTTCWSKKYATKRPQLGITTQEFINCDRQPLESVNFFINKVTGGFVHSNSCLELRS